MMEIIAPPSLGAGVQELLKKHEPDPYQERLSDKRSECWYKRMLKLLGAEQAPLPGRSQKLFRMGHLEEWMLLGGTLDPETADWYGIPRDLVIKGDLERVCGITITHRQQTVMAPTGWGGGLRPGHIDGVGTTADGLEFVIDVKSTSSANYQGLERLQWQPTDYAEQEAVYADCMGVDSFCIYIVSRDIAALQEFWFQKMGRLWVNTYHWSTSYPGENLPLAAPVDTARVIRDLQQRNGWVCAFAYIAKLTGKLPERPYPYGTNFPCGWCRFESPVCDQGCPEILVSNPDEKPTPVQAKALGDLRRAMDAQNEQKRLDKQARDAITAMMLRDKKERLTADVGGQIATAEMTFKEEKRSDGTTHKVPHVKFSWKKGDRNEQ